MQQPTVTINKRGAERVRGGHLWVYRSDVRRGGDAEQQQQAAAPGGAVVRVRDERGRLHGQAFYSDRSEITLRVLTHHAAEEVNRDWWRERLRRAISRRDALAEGAEAYRLIYSEGDMLPGLIVDKYGDVLVLQTLAQGTEALKSLFAELLIELTGARSIVERNDVRVRALEGLEMKSGVLAGEEPGELTINQHGVRFTVAPLTGQKTGAFLDQRENYLAARRYARGRALDCFTFHGGFALNVAQSCESVVGIDVSGEAIAAARRNAELNELQGRVEFREANVFDALRELENAGEKFDTVVLDPPAFAKNRASIEAAARGYKEINLRAFKLLAPGGTLVTCTCSYHVSEGMFSEVVSAAAADAHRRAQITEKRIQARDHPVLLGVPETLYLKCLVVRAVD